MQRSRSHQILSAHFATLLLVCATATCSALAQEKFDAGSDELFVFRPDTPERQIRGAILAEKLDRPGLAQGYLAELLDSQPTQQELRQLRSTFGIGTFLKLSSTKELQPRSRELLQMINDASRAEPATASTVELLIDELGQSKQQTLEASLKILSAEGDAAVPLLAADRSTVQGAIADRLLQKYTRRFQHGLVAALSDADPATQVRIMELLKGSANPEIVFDFCRFRFSDSPEVAAATHLAIQKLSKSSSGFATKQDAINSLHDEIVTLIRRAGKAYPLISDHANDRRLQGIPADQQTVYGVGFLRRAVTLTGITEQILPESVEVLAAKMVAELTEQSWPIAWPGELPLPTTAVDELAEVDILALQIAARTENAAAILSLLRRTQIAAGVLANSPALTRQLLMHSDSRVRLLTAGLIDAAGGNNFRTYGTLAAAVSSTEKPEALVIDTRDGEGPTVAAVMNDIGYKTASSRTGQGGFEIATGQMQCELILVQSNCLRWPLSQTIANLRTDYRTADIPIVVYGPERDRSATELARSGYEGVWYLAEPVSDETSNIDQSRGVSGRVTDSTIVTERFRLEGIPQAKLSKEERRQMIRFALSLR